MANHTHEQLNKFSCFIEGAISSSDSSSRRPNGKIELKLNDDFLLVALTKGPFLTLRLFNYSGLALLPNDTAAHVSFSLRGGAPIVTEMMENQPTQKKEQYQNNDPDALLKVRKNHRAAVVVINEITNFIVKPNTLSTGVLLAKS